MLVATSRKRHGWHIDASVILAINVVPLIARFMGPTWGLPGTDRTQVGPMWATRNLLSGTWWLVARLFRSRQLNPCRFIAIVPTNEIECRYLQCNKHVCKCEYSLCLMAPYDPIEFPYHWLPCQHITWTNVDFFPIGLSWIKLSEIVVRMKILDLELSSPTR